MGKNIVLDATDTSHIKYGKVEKPAPKPLVYRQTPTGWAKRTVEDKRKAEWGTEK